MTQKEMSLILDETNLKKRKKLINRILKNKNEMSRTFYMAILTT